MHYAGMLTRPGVSSQGQGQKSQGQGQGQRSRLRSNSIVRLWPVIAVWCKIQLIHNKSVSSLGDALWPYIYFAMAVPMTLVYQCTVSVIIPRYTVFGRILVTLTLALNKAKARNTRPRPSQKPQGQGQGQGLTTLRFSDTYGL